MNNNFLNLSDLNFEENIKTGNTILVDFWADWCTPCKNMNSTIRSIKSEYLKKIFIAKLNVEENFKVSSKYNIRSVPTLIIFKEGKEIERIVGSISLNKLEEFIKRNI
ncbi:thioredoxin [Candidatus Riesia pediculischaeffi]|uniref:Thioredoxin n=2 Tax=Candidatus Riesia pediculischaeffi TaxID=428411 RepID=A0A1V0HL04_9ENTR|nr:thioredoxin [Candidatus Riesia pediculischaeffi]ARC53527.1 thioredoxin [Candidatus Riesia pediculischaeffi]